MIAYEWESYFLCFFWLSAYMSIMKEDYSTQVLLYLVGLDSVGVSGFYFDELKKFILEVLDYFLFLV